MPCVLVALAVLARAIAGNPMAGTPEAGVLARVHVQEIARAGPLVPVGRLSLGTGRPRDPRPLQHLPDGRVAEAGCAGDQSRPPARPQATGADRLGELGSELARRAVGTARAIEQAGERPSCLLAGLCPAMPPAVRRRRRHPEGGRGRLQRHPALDRIDKRVAAGKSELGVTVQRHPSPPSCVSRGRPTASKEGRIDLSAVHNVCRQDI